MSELNATERHELLNGYRADGETERERIVSAVKHILAERLADARATEAVLRGEIRRSESALATFDDLTARLAEVEALHDVPSHPCAGGPGFGPGHPCPTLAVLHPDPSEAGA